MRSPVPTLAQTPCPPTPRRSLPPARPTSLQNSPSSRSGRSTPIKVNQANKTRTIRPRPSRRCRPYPSHPPHPSRAPERLVSPATCSKDRAVAEELLQHKNTHPTRETESSTTAAAAAGGSAEAAADVGSENQERRARARRSLLWAYASVGLVLLVLLALALAALGVGWRATELRGDAENQQRRAVLAERRAESELEKTYLAQARGHRFGSTLARREATLDIVRRASALQPTVELRDEAVAALALTDFQLESSTAISADVRSLTFSPDLLTSAEGLANGDILLRRLSDGAEISRLTPAAGGIPAEQGSVLLVEFSPDGGRLTARHFGGALAIWDVAGKKTLLVYDIDKVRHPAALARFSSDGKFVAGPIATPAEGQGVIEVETGRLVASFPQFSRARHTAVRPGAPEFAVNDGKNIVVINWETREQVAAFDFPAGCRHLQWSDDGRRLGIAGNVLEAHVWDYPEKKLHVFPNHYGDIHTILFDPRGELMATSAGDGQTRLWDLRNGRLLGTENGRGLRLGTQGRIGMEKTQEPLLTVHRIGPSPVYQRWRGPALQVKDLQAMDISPEGDAAATAVAGEGLRLWNLRDPGASPVWYDYPGLDSVCFNPATSALLAGRADGPVSHDWRAAPRDGRGLPGPSTPVRPMQGQSRHLLLLTNDGQRIAGVNVEAGFIYAANMSDTRELFSIKGKYNTLARSSSSARGGGTLSFSPDNRWLVCGVAGGDGVVVFDSTTGQPVKNVDTDPGAVQFSLDGRWLVISHRGRCQLVRTSDWGTAWEQKNLPRYAATTAAFSPDGNLVAAPDSAITVAIWDTATGRRLCSLEAPEAVPVTVLRWSADGSRLVCGLRDQNLEAWEISALGQELSALGLGWDTPLTVAAPPPLPAAPNFPFRLLAAGVLVTGGGAAAIALLSLRRHRHLISGIVHSDALALQRERDLEAARELNHLKNTFVSMVSHEFRTPLAVILSSAELLSNHLDRLSPERRAQQLESIRGSTRRMAQLVDDVLLLGKVEGGSMTCNPAPLPLREFCETLVDEALSATSRRCPIVLTFAAGLPETILADESLLRHVLSNLLSNAAKYSPENSPASLTVGKTTPDTLTFTIADQGIGIPAADLPRLFQPFQRAGNVGQISGTGLGLMIAKRCAEIHHGTLEITSTVGEGTTVTVTLKVLSQPPSPNSSNQ
jgi:signal transduction histidine kinase